MIARRLRLYTPVTCILIASLGCGDGADRDASLAVAADGDVAAAAGEPATGAAEPGAADPEAVVSGAAGAATGTAEGLISFTVAGEPRTFEHLPADENYYLRLSSAVVAHPSPSATESLRITFLGLDLRGHTYPGELPPAEAGTTLATAMATVGFSYTEPGGEEWAGPGRILIESFDESGLLVGTFDGVSLPHTDDERPPITLSQGRVRVLLD